MSDWLIPVARALERRIRPLELFIRDDDAGWVDDRLFALLDVCARHGRAIDLAAIPAAVHDRLAGQLIDRADRGDAIGLHQHGYSHANHEPEGRPCEFGAWRTRAMQQRDIAEGRRLLLGLFAARVDPIFTPPWNRCAPFTWECLLNAGLTAISRDRTAVPFARGLLAECAIHVDWFARVKGARLDRSEWGRRLGAEMAVATAPLGLMLHHAAMDGEELAAFDALLALCAQSGVRGLLMREVLGRRKALAS